MLIVLDKIGPLPLYQQIVEEMKGKIVSGRFKPGDPLPSIRQLAADLTISVITTKRAYLELEGLGLIRTRPGLGTFVGEMGSAAARDLGLDEVRARLQDAVGTALRLGVPLSRLGEMLTGLVAAESEEPAHE